LQRKETEEQEVKASKTKMKRKRKTKEGNRSRQSQQAEEKKSEEEEETKQKRKKKKREKHSRATIVHPCLKVKVPPHIPGDFFGGLLGSNIHLLPLYPLLILLLLTHLLLITTLLLITILPTILLTIPMPLLSSNSLLLSLFSSLVFTSGLLDVRVESIFNHLDDLCHGLVQG
jgi:cation transport ATPase